MQNINKLLNNCHTVEEKEALIERLDDIYAIIKDNGVSITHRKEALVRLFGIRNEKLQNANVQAMTRHFNQWIGNTIDDIYLAHIWNLLRDAHEFAKPFVQGKIYDYLASWLRDPIFNENVPLRRVLRFKFYAAEYLLINNRPGDTEIGTIFLLTAAENTEYSTFIRGDAMDILIRNGVTQTFRQRVEQVRNDLRVLNENDETNLRRQAAELGVAYVPEPLRHYVTTTGAGTIYTDAQNVHVTEINEAIKGSLLIMLKDPEVRGNTVSEVVDQITTALKALGKSEIQTGNALDALRRFREDPAVFTERRVTMGAALVMVWNRIQRHEQATDLHQRLFQELCEAFNTCATGHLSRLVSVLIGYYPDIVQFTSFETQLVENIKARLYALIKKAPEDLSGDLIIALAESSGPEHKLLVEFWNEHSPAIHTELHAEFVPKYLSDETFNIIFEMNRIK